MTAMIGTTTFDAVDKRIKTRIRHIDQTMEQAEIDRRISEGIAQGFAHDPKASNVYWWHCNGAKTFDGWVSRATEYPDCNK